MHTHMHVQVHVHTHVDVTPQVRAKWRKRGVIDLSEGNRVEESYSVHMETLLKRAVRPGEEVRTALLDVHAAQGHPHPHTGTLSNLRIK